jgi:hypothetical protein
VPSFHLFLYRVCVILFNAKLLLTLHTCIYFVHSRGRVSNNNSRKLFFFCICGLNVIAYIKKLEMSIQLTIASLADCCFCNLDFFGNNSVLYCVYSK